MELKFTCTSCKSTLEFHFDYPDRITVDPCECVLENCPKCEEITDEKDEMEATLEKKIQDRDEEISALENQIVEHDIESLDLAKQIEDLKFQLEKYDFL